METKLQQTWVNELKKCHETKFRMIAVKEFAKSLKQKNLQLARDTLKDKNDARCVLFL